MNCIVAVEAMPDVSRMFSARELTIRRRFVPETTEKHTSLSVSDADGHVNIVQFPEIYSTKSHISIPLSIDHAYKWS